MLYVFFEHHKDASGKTLATDVTVSSWLHGKGINWGRDNIAANVMVGKGGLLKTPPIAVRSYNEPLKLWTYLGDAGYHLLEVLQETFDKLKMQIEFRECSELERHLEEGGIPDEATTKFDPKNFFYNKAGVNTTQEITKDVAIQKLSVFFDLDLADMQKLGQKDAKRLYREQAKMLHPDHNGGDGSRMSELNMYWRVYVG